MKSKTIGSFFVVLALVVGIIAFAPSAFAADKVEVTITKGSSADQTCVTANNCFDPAQTNVTPGTEVEWTNADTASHTVTSGKPSDETTGTLFDSSLIKAGATYEFTFADAGTFDYYCQVHPWMTGQVIVAAEGGTTGGVTLGGMQVTSMSGMNMIGAMTMEKMMSTDGSTEVSITTPTTPVSGKPFTIELAFKNSNGNLIQHQNYVITVMQDGNSVLSNGTGHTHTGNDVQTTNTLTSTNPVDIQVTLTGVGLPGTDPSIWTGPKDDMLSFHVVPEFGPITSLILVIAVVSVIAVTAKTRGFLKL